MVEIWMVSLADVFGFTMILVLFGDNIFAFVKNIVKL